MEHRVRLLVVTHSLSGGGAERFAGTLLSHLDRERFEPLACLARDLRGYDLAPDVPVEVLGYRELWSLPRTVRRLRRLLAARRPQVVLSNVLSTSRLVRAALPTGGASPAWVARVGNEPSRADPLLQRLGAGRAYRGADAVVCNSRGLGEAFEGRFPDLAGRLRVIANPTDFAALERSAGEAPPRRAEPGVPTLLWVGRLTPQKRPDLALEVLARVRREAGAGLARTRLWMCGEGPLAGSVERRAAELGLGAAVDRLGFVSNPFPLMRQADLLLATSDFEGLPNALIEAQGLGLPAVATRCPHGPAEVVEEGVTGLLAPPGEALALAGAAALLLRDGERRRHMGDAAQARARRLFGLEARMADWEELLAGVAARPGYAPPDRSAARPRPAEP